MIQGIVRNTHPIGPVASLHVREGGMGDGAQVILRERLQLEDAAAADKGPVHLEVGILRGRSDEDDRSIFHPGKERVLLGFVPAIHLVDKERRAPAIEVAVVLRNLYGFPELLHPGEHGVHGDEMALRGIGNHLREGGFPRARRPVEDQGRYLVGLDDAAQEPSGPDDMLLAGELLQRAGPHTVRQGLVSIVH